MKRIVPILFLSLFLISSTELNQLLKLPVLFEHFTEHKELNQKISFLEFLCMHYTDHHKHDKGVTDDGDDDRDMQLPFKSHDNCSMHIQIVTPKQETITFRMISAPDKSYSLDKTFDFSSSYLSSIWQPPKAC